MSVIDLNTTGRAYRRDNDCVGVRNHVIIPPVDDLSNAATLVPDKERMGYTKAILMLPLKSGTGVVDAAGCADGDTVHPYIIPVIGITSIAK